MAIFLHEHYGGRQNINFVFLVRPGDNFVPFGRLSTCANFESICTSLTRAAQQSEFSLIKTLECPNRLRPVPRLKNPLAEQSYNV